MALELRAPAFEQGGTIPRKYTCDGDNVSPALRWSGVPEGTRSLVLLCNDPDAPGGTFRHWAVYDIPPDRRELAEGHGPETLRDGSEAGAQRLRQAGLRRALPARAPWRAPLSFAPDGLERAEPAAGPGCQL